MSKKAKKPIGSRWWGSKKENSRPGDRSDADNAQPGSATSAKSRKGTKLGPPGADAIILDDRERASGLHEAILEVCGRPPLIERLEVGDAIVGSRYLIERKSASDFEASISDGRLFRQLIQMREQRYEPMLIIESPADPDSERRLPERAIQGAILRVALDWRVPILPSTSVRNTAQWFASLLARDASGDAPPDWRGVTPRGQRAQSLPRRPQRKPLSAKGRYQNQSLAILSQIEGVGEVKAKALLREFKTLGAILAASHEELARTPQVGSRLAARIRDAFAEGPPEARNATE